MSTPTYSLAQLQTVANQLGVELSITLDYWERARYISLRLGARTLHLQVDGHPTSKDKQEALTYYPKWEYYHKAGKSTKNARTMQALCRKVDKALAASEQSKYSAYLATVAALDNILKNA